MGEHRWCSGCAADTAFDRFDCADHPAGCVELVCTVCGYGVELGVVQVVVTAPERRRRRAA